MYAHTQGHTGGVCACQLNAGSLVTVGEDATHTHTHIHIHIHTHTYMYAHTQGHTGGVCACQLNAGSLVTVGEDATVKWWDLETLNCMWSENKAHGGPIW